MKHTRIRSREIVCNNRENFINNNKETKLQCIKVAYKIATIQLRNDRYVIRLFSSVCCVIKQALFYLFVKIFHDQSNMMIMNNLRRFNAICY